MRIFVQAGHEGLLRNSGSGTTSSVGNPGIRIPERSLTPVVANQVAAILRDMGETAFRSGGVIPSNMGRFDLAVFLHYDGASPRCASGASVGYPSSTPASAVRAWKTLYARSFPYKWQNDNFTAGLRGYYGYGRVDAPIKLLIEFGELTCPDQEPWLVKNSQDGTLAALVVSWMADVLDMEGAPMALSGTEEKFVRDMKNGIDSIGSDASFARGAALLVRNNVQGIAEGAAKTAVDARSRSINAQKDINAHKKNHPSGGVGSHRIVDHSDVLKPSGVHLASVDPTAPSAKMPLVVRATTEVERKVSVPGVTSVIVAVLMFLADYQGIDLPIGVAEETVAQVGLAWGALMTLAGYFTRSRAPK